MSGNLLMPSGWATTKCIDAAIDTTMVTGYGPGRPVDYILHVTSSPCDGGTVAYAGVCAVGGEDSRPIMGAINLCPGSYDKLAPRRQIEVIIHELLHAFVSAPGRVCAGFRCTLQPLRAIVSVRVGAYVPSAPRHVCE